MFELAVLLSILLATIHFLAGRLMPLEQVPRSQWLSAAGGISVSYVFVRLLPELAEGRQHIKALVERRWLGVGSFLMALAGLVIFYGLERLAKSPRRSEMTGSAGIFWIHTVSFAVYSSAAC